MLAAFVALLVYNANFRVIAQGDSFPARFLPLAVWGEGTLYLDDLHEVTTQRLQGVYWILWTPSGHFASMYPVVTPLLVTPLYAPAVLYLQKAGWSYDNMSRVGKVMEKLAGSFVAAAAVGLMFLVLRRRLERRDALLLTGAFAFGTSTWSISSQALWQHGPAELLLLAALWFVTGEPSRRSALLAGLATGLLAANRPPDVLLAAGLSLYALVWARRRAALFVPAAAVPVALALLYNWTTFRRLAGGYGAGGVDARFFSGDLLPGIAGLLVSPAAGLFVFCPFLLFLPLLFHRSLRDERYLRLTLLLAGSVFFQILLYASTDWRAGYSYGPRFLTDAVPALVWMLAPVLTSLGRPARAAFVACSLFAVGVQYVGAFHYTGGSSILYHTPPEMSNVWNPRNAAFLLEAGNPRQPAEVLHLVRSLAAPDRLHLPDR